jgi:hypothetical protein
MECSSRICLGGWGSVELHPAKAILGPKRLSDRTFGNLPSRTWDYVFTVPGARDRAYFRVLQGLGVPRTILDREDAAKRPRL